MAHGRGLGEVAVIADISFNITEEHYDFRNYVIRNRILEVYGDHGNHVIWRHKGNPPDYAARRFDTMNEWLAAVEADTRNVPLRQKIIERQARAGGGRVLALRPVAAGVTDPVILQHRADSAASASTVTGSGASAVYSPTDDEWPVFRDTRVASGEPLTSDIMRAALKQPQRSDYTVGFQRRAVGAAAGGVPVRRLRLLAPGDWPGRASAVADLREWPGRSAARRSARFTTGCLSLTGNADLNVKAVQLRSSPSRRAMGSSPFRIFG